MLLICSDLISQTFNPQGPGKFDKLVLRAKTYEKGGGFTLAFTLALNLSNFLKQ